MKNMEKKIIIPLAIVAVLVAGGYVYQHRYQLFTFENGSIQIAEKPVELAILGTWRSADDPKFTREFTEDGKVIDRYEGDASADVEGRWYVTSTAEIPFSIPVVEGATDIKLQFPDGNYFFRVADVSRTSLTLIYLERGNSLRFERAR
jgi:hypothetical protein